MFDQNQSEKGITELQESRPYIIQNHFSCQNEQQQHEQELINFQEKNNVNDDFTNMMSSPNYKDNYIPLNINNNNNNSNNNTMEMDSMFKDNILLSDNQLYPTELKQQQQQMVSQFSPNSSNLDMNSYSHIMQNYLKNKQLILHPKQSIKCLNESNDLMNNIHPKLINTPSQKRFQSEQYRKTSIYYQSPLQGGESILHQSDKEMSRFGQRFIQFQGEQRDSLNSTHINQPHKKSLIKSNNNNIINNLLNNSIGSPFHSSFSRKDKLLSCDDTILQSKKGKQQPQQQNQNQQLMNENCQSTMKNLRVFNIIQQIQINQINRANRIQQLVKRFIEVLMIQSSQNFINRLQKFQFDYINDLSSFYLVKEKSRVLDKLQIYIDNLIQSLPFTIPLFMPTELFLLIWDISMVLYTVPMLMILSIITFCAQKEDSTMFFYCFFIIAFIVFLLDIIFSFNTAHFNKDLIVLDRKLIAKKYIKSYFIPDFIVVIVLFLKLFLLDHSVYDNQNDNNKLVLYTIHILIFLKSISIPRKIAKLDDVLQARETSKHNLKLLKLIASIILIAHSFGIGWHIVAAIEKSYGVEYTWITKLNIENETWLTKYTYSFYWCITTMTTVGFGDITPANEYEGFFMSITMILMSCIFAYTISNIGMILQEIEKNHRELTNNISNIQRYLNRKNVNFSLKSRVRNYLVFLAEEQKDRNKEAEDQVFSKLSNKLREEITLEVNGRIVNNNPIFTKNFSESSLNKIIFAMKECLVSPNEILFSEGSIDDKAIYFIQSGYIDIFYQLETDNNKDNHHIWSKRLGPNQIFGELSFFSGLPRKAGAKSVNLATLYKLTQEDFLKIITDNKDDFEKYKMIQEQILFQQDVQDINTECYCCNALGHIAKNCPLIHSQRNKQFIALQNNFSIIQSRSKNFYPQSNRIRFDAKQMIEINKVLHERLKGKSQFMSSSIRLLFTKDQLDSQNSHSLNESNSYSNDDDEDYEDEDDEDNNTNNQKDSQLIIASQNNIMNISRQQQQQQQSNRYIKNKKKSDDLAQNKSLTSLLNIPFQEMNKDNIIDEQNNDIILSKDDIFHIITSQQRISSVQDVLKLQQQQQQQFGIQPLINNTNQYLLQRQFTSEKQKSNHDSNNNNNFGIKLDSQIIEEDEEQPLSIRLKSNQNIQNNSNLDNKKLKKKIASKEQIAFREEYDLLINSQEIPILIPQVLNIRIQKGRNSILELYQQQQQQQLQQPQQQQQQSNINKDEYNMKRKKKQRYATQPPVHLANNSPFNINNYMAMKKDYNNMNELRQNDKKKSILIKDSYPAQMNISQQSIKTINKPKKRASVLKKNLLNHLATSDKLNNSNNNITNNNINSNNGLNQFLQNNMNNNDEDMNFFNLLHYNNQNQRYSQNEFNKLILLNQIKQRSHYTQLDQNEQNDSQIFLKLFSKDNYFEEMKLFKTFFPHNNFDKVIQNIKNMLKKQKKQKNHLNIKLKKLKQNGNNNNNIQNQSGQLKRIQNDDESNNKIHYGEELKPSYLSYGIAVPNLKLHPINNLSNFN